MRLVYTAFFALGLGVIATSSHGNGSNLDNSLLGPFLKTATVAEIKKEMEFFSIYDRDEYGNTVLHNAVSSNPAVIEFLLSQGLGIHQRNKWESTPIMRAAGGAGTDNPIVIDVLVAHNANVNDHNSFGQTVMMLVAGRVTYDDKVETVIPIMERLLFHGADIFAVDNDGKTALDYARRPVDVESVTRNKSDIASVKANQQRVVAFIESEMAKRKPQP